MKKAIIIKNWLTENQLKYNESLSKFGRGYIMLQFTNTNNSLASTDGQKVTGFDNAAETMGLAKNKMLGYALHFKHFYWAVADSLTTEIQKYESADVYDYLNASSQDLGELIKDVAKEYLEWSNQ